MRIKMLNVLSCIRRTFCQLSLLYGYKIVEFLPKSCTLYSNEKEDWQGSASEKITENHFLIFIYLFIFLSK